METVPFSRFAEVVTSPPHECVPRRPDWHAGCRQRTSVLEMVPLVRGHPRRTWTVGV